MTSKTLKKNSKRKKKREGLWCFGTPQYSIYYGKGVSKIVVTEVTQLFKAAVEQTEPKKINWGLMDVDSVNKSLLAVFLTNSCCL